MHGEIRRDGTLTITLNVQSEVLAAPDGKKYLPCEWCREILAVELRVVSLCCENCTTARDLGFTRVDVRDRQELGRPPVRAKTIRAFLTLSTKRKAQEVGQEIVDAIGVGRVMKSHDAGPLLTEESTVEIQVPADELDQAHDLLEAHDDVRIFKTLEG